MRSSPNAALASRLALTIAGRKLAGRAHDAHAAAAAAGGGLDQHRKADLVGGLRQRRLVLGLAVIAGHQRHAGLFHQRFRAGLRAHRRHHRGGRADEHQPGIGAGLREFGIFRQKAVAGMHGLGAGLARRLDHALDIEIAVARPRRPEQHGLVGHRRHASRRDRPRNRPRPCAGPWRARCGSRGRRSRRDWRSGACGSAGTVWSDPSSHPEQAEARRLDRRVGRRRQARGRAPAAYRRDRSRRHPTAARWRNTDCPGFHIARGSARGTRPPLPPTRCRPWPRCCRGGPGSAPSTACSPPITEMRAFGHIQRKRGL